MLRLLKKIARIIARINDVQKLRQKSQSNNSEMSFGAFAIISSRMPILLINNIIKADVSDIAHTKAQNSIIKYIVDIIL